MKIIIPIIVGAVIGYCTNWLAIKMLFKPYYEKRIMGIKIPFTPGLIPKERNRIGKSIGEAVGVYLLSPDTIIESLSNEKTDEQIKSWLNSKINKLKENNKSIKEILSLLPEENYISLIGAIEENIIKIIFDKIRGQHFNHVISSFIQNKIDNIDSHNIYKVIDEKLEMLLSDIANSDELKNGLINFIYSKIEEIESYDHPISEILPKEILAYINKYIDENGETIANNLRENFKNPDIQDKLKNSISELVSQNINKLIIAFISPDVISEKIFHVVEKYIDSEDTNKDIIMIIRSMLDNLLKSKTSIVMSNIKNSLSEEDISKIVDILISYILHKDNQNNLLNLIGQKLKDTESKNKEWIKDYLIKNIKVILDSQQMEDAIKLFIQDIIKQFINKPISNISVGISEDIGLKTYNLFKVLFHGFARNELPDIIEMFNISKIVEDKLNSFDVEFTEKLILDIASKELRAITWLGALLGAILGILSPLLQMIY